VIREDILHAKICYCMKKIVSLPMYGLAVLAMLTSCVAKKKYTEAQNQITQLQTENAQLKETGTTMQTNITSLEANNRALQSSLDSTHSWVTGQQSRWSSFQAFYDEGMKTTEQVHQQLHTEMDNLIGSENITTSGGRVHVNLKESVLFASGSSKLSKQGSEVLTKLAEIVSQNPNVEIDIASGPGYYGGDNMASSDNMNNNMNNQNSTMNNNMNNQNSTTKVDADGDVKMKSDNTKVKMDADGDVKVKTSANKSYSSTAKKSTAHKTTSGTRRTSTESSAKARTYKSSPAKKTSASSTWSLNMARSSSIAKKLVDEGVMKSRILVKKGTDDAAAGTTKKDFQIIISPKSDTYYNSLGNQPSGGSTPSNQ